MRSSEEFKWLVYAKRDKYYEKKKYRNKKIVKYATAVTVCSFIIYFSSDVWKYSGGYDGNCKNASGSGNLIESMKSEVEKGNTKGASEKYEVENSIEIIGKIGNEPYKKICNDEEKIKKIMECIDTSNSRGSNDVDDYMVITVKDNNGSLQQYSMDGENAKKIVEVLGNE